MIDYGESDSMIEIRGKLDESNSEFRRRCVICRFFIPSNFFKLKAFSEFFYLKANKEFVFK